MDGATIYRILFGEDVQPDRWQLALTTDAWPQVLIAPTGAGKTAAVTLGWIAHRLRNPDRTPRRLVWCLPMRTLVEQTTQLVRDWLEKLAGEVGSVDQLPKRKDVYVLMGGVDSSDWLRNPEHPAVLVGTQDMLLSRALMRGYASSRAIWPMEFALLHEDAQWVFDEVQLMGAGRATSAQLEAFRQASAARSRSECRPMGSPSRSLWISATLDPQWLATVDHPQPCPESVVRVDPAMEPDGRLARLSRATKRLTRSSVAPKSAKKSDITSYIRELADAILNKHRTGFMTLAIVNRVDRAQELYKEIDKKLLKQKPTAPTLALVHSRFRPADRQRETDKVIATSDQNPNGRIVVATQAVEAGLDISAAVMFTEISSWSSMVQRFGRVNRYAELPDGAEVHWLDLLQPTADGGSSDKEADALAIPYTVAELRCAQGRLSELTDVAPEHLPPPDNIEPPRRVIRRKDLYDLFDTDPDLTGFDVDVSPYVRDADDTDIRVFWRDLATLGDDPPRPCREELCAVSIGAARKWIETLRTKNVVFQRDPQWRRHDGRRETVPPGWAPFQEKPWPGLILLADRNAGGYRESVGFTGDPKDVPEPVVDPVAPAGASAAPNGSAPMTADESEGHDEDPLSQIGTVVTLADHLRHVATEAESLCSALGVDDGTRAAVVRAAHWHDLGKAHEVFQETMRRGLNGQDVPPPDVLLAKTLKRSRHGRAYFRHELASALAFLAHENWSRDADLIAYLIAAHHGKVRLNLRALPKEGAPEADSSAGTRFARGVWEGDQLPPLDLESGECWEGGSLLLSIMELGWDAVSRESWTERTRELLARFGPFHLAWLETLPRIADRRASKKERNGSYS